MTHKDTKFAMREAKAREAMRWMRASADRALNEGAKEVLISCQDMLDLCAYIESRSARERHEFSGKPLGFCNHLDIRKLLSRQVGGISLRARKGPKFAYQVCFVGELPPQVELDQDGIPMDTVQNASLAQAES